MILVVFLASCALMMPGGAALARAYETRVEPPAPGFSSSQAPDAKSLLIEQAFRIWSVIEDDSPLRGSPCGPLLTQRSLASLESNLLPRRFSSSLAPDAKSLLIEQAFRIWSVIEDDSPLRGSPYGPLLTQRSLASLESNLLPRRFSSSLASDAKSLLIEQAFRIWSVIEDSNLRPLRPERSALPSCANHRMRGASYCWDAYPSMPYFQKSLNRRETQQPEQRIAGCSTF